MIIETKEENINFELFVKFLDALSEKEFELFIDWGNGQLNSIYWPHVFLIKYKAPNVYKILVSDYSNECYLITKLYYLLCIKMDVGIEGVDFDPLLKFTVQKLGGIVNTPVSCEFAKEQLLRYQNYMYQVDPSLKTKVFFPELLKIPLA